MHPYPVQALGAIYLENTMLFQNLFGYLKINYELYAAYRSPKPDMGQVGGMQTFDLKAFIYAYS